MKKVVLIVILTLIVCTIVFLGVTYLFTDFIPNMKVDREIKSFYGT